MSSDTRVATLPPRPIMVFDGDCGFCKLWIRRWRQMTGEKVDYLPAQDPRIAAQFPEIPRERFSVAVQLIETDGQVYAGAEAVVRAMAHAEAHRWPLRAYQLSPVLATTMELGYRVVANHRGFFSWLTRRLWGRHVERPTHVLAQWIFLRGLGLVYLVAFLSLWTQISGLIGHHGILPVDRLMAGVRQQCDLHGIGWDRYRMLPTLCWLDSSDGFLGLQCAAGAVLAGALIVDLAPVPCLALLWLLYLSLATVGREFLGFQWDSLLLETGFLAIFLAPVRLWPWRPAATRPSRTAVWLLRLLLFKLMLSSGCVKLSSGDPTWRHLIALSFHYQTQPLPTLLAWYANQWPLWFHKACSVFMFAVELLVPFLIFAPRRLRFLGGYLLISLQILILVTGNYAFFNLLTLTLCLLLFDDSALRAVLPTALSQRLSHAHASLKRPRWHRATTWTAAVLVVPLTLAQINLGMGAPLTVPRALELVDAWLLPLRTLNGYGLFAVMTTERKEIVVEGSDDGVTWLPYQFKYKPGDVNRRPTFVAPHQPRLDWQMWFAALGSRRDHRWFTAFCVRLLQGRPEVLALLRDNPFHDHAPKFVRAELYHYDFTETAERRASGAWWRHERVGEYMPAISLEGLHNN